MTDSPAPTQPPPGPSSPQTRTTWNWLLVVPVLLVIWPPLYNLRNPELFGLPFFYWFQLAVIPISVLCTVLVYRAGRAGRAGREGGRR